MRAASLRAMWLWIDLAIALMPVAMLVIVTFSLLGRIKRVRGELKAISPPLAKVKSPARP